MITVRTLLPPVSGTFSKCDTKAGPMTRCCTVAMFCSFPSRIADRRRTAVGRQTVSKKGLPEVDRKRAARFLSFPLHAALEETLKRLKNCLGESAQTEAKPWQPTSDILPDQFKSSAEYSLKGPDVMIRGFEGSCHSRNFANDNRGPMRFHEIAWRSINALCSAARLNRLSSRNPPRSRPKLQLDSSVPSCIAVTKTKKENPQ
jgi:hypothetical protein